MLYFRYAMGREMMIVARFVPKDKLSKKALKEVNRQRRVTWDFSPVTRTVGSRKLYNRKKIARSRDDNGPGDFNSMASDHTQPWASMASATFRKPAMLAPTT